MTEKAGAGAADAKKDAASTSNAVASSSSSSTSAPPPAMNSNDIMSLMNNLALMQQSSSQIASMRKQAKDMEAHKFWSTQPVPKNGKKLRGNQRKATIWI